MLHPNILFISDHTPRPVNQMELVSRLHTHVLFASVLSHRQHSVAHQKSPHFQAETPKAHAFPRLEFALALIRNTSMPQVGVLSVHTHHTHIRTHLGIVLDYNCLLVCQAHALIMMIERKIIFYCQ